MVGLDKKWQDMVVQDMVGDDNVGQDIMYRVIILSVMELYEYLFYTFHISLVEGIE